MMSTHTRPRSHSSLDRFRAAKGIALFIAALVLSSIATEARGTFAVIVTIACMTVSGLLILDIHRLIVDGRAARRALRAETARIIAYTAALEAGEANPSLDHLGRTRQETRAEQETRWATSSDPRIQAAYARLVAARAEGQEHVAAARARLIDAQLEQIVASAEVTDGPL